MQVETESELESTRVPGCLAFGRFSLRMYGTAADRVTVESLAASFATAAALHVHPCSAMWLIIPAYNDVGEVGLEASICYTKACSELCISHTVIFHTP